MKILVEYEVYRFKKWWKNSFETKFNTPEDLDWYLKTCNVMVDFYHQAKREDQWEIRNLTYKIIKK